MDKDNLDEESKKALGAEHVGRFSHFLKAEEARGTLTTDESRKKLTQDITKRIGCLFWVVLVVGVGIGLLLATVIL